MTTSANYRTKWARIGDSVPPLFMKAIAEKIRRNLFSPSFNKLFFDFGIHGYAP
jgi:hypothetical protein